MEQHITALRVHADIASRTGDWVNTAQKLLLLAADLLEQQKRDHIGAHRVSADTIRQLEQKLSRAGEG